MTTQEKEEELEYRLKADPSDTHLKVILIKGLFLANIAEIRLDGRDTDRSKLNFDLSPTRASLGDRRTLIDEHEDFVLIDAPRTHDVRGKRGYGMGQITRECFGKFVCEPPQARLSPITNDRREAHSTRGLLPGVPVPSARLAHPGSLYYPEQSLSSHRIVMIAGHARAPVKKSALDKPGEWGRSAIHWI